MNEGEGCRDFAQFKPSRPFQRDPPPHSTEFPPTTGAHSFSMPKPKIEFGVSTFSQGTSFYSAHRECTQSDVHSSTLTRSGPAAPRPLPPSPSHRCSLAVHTFSEGGTGSGDGVLRRHTTPERRTPEARGRRAARCTWETTRHRRREYREWRSSVLEVAEKRGALLGARVPGAPLTQGDSAGLFHTVFLSEEAFFAQ